MNIEDKENQNSLDKPLIQKEKENSEHSIKGLEIPEIQVEKKEQKEAKSPVKALPATNAKSSSPRIVSLDIFRGLTMMGMLLANHQMGSPLLWILRHAEGNGCTTTDLIFPSFLFISGMAIVLSIKRPEDPKSRKETGIRVVKRIILLFAIGLSLNIIVKKFDWPIIRIMGILQRISLSYGVVTIIHLTLKNVWFHYIILAALAIIYIGVMYGADIPNFIDDRGNVIVCGRGVVTEYCNAGAYIDQSVFGRSHMIGPNEPEGLLSTLTSVITLYIGYFFGMILTKYKNDNIKLAKVWYLVGGVLAVGSATLSLAIPLNKKVWSFTFCIFAAGIAGCTLTIIMVLRDILFPKSKVMEIISRPFIGYGMNPLGIFVGYDLLDIIFLKYIIGEGGKKNLFSSIYKYVFQSGIHINELASLLHGLFYFIIWLVIAGGMHKKNIFIKL